MKSKYFYWEYNYLFFIFFNCAYNFVPYLLFIVQCLPVKTQIFINIIKTPKDYKLYLLLLLL